jgi:magnesium-transporting ATPase (P-type)
MAFAICVPRNRDLSTILATLALMSTLLPLALSAIIYFAVACHLVVLSSDDDSLTNWLGILVTYPVLLSSSGASIPK